VIRPTSFTSATFLLLILWLVTALPATQLARASISSGQADVVWGQPSFKAGASCGDKPRTASSLCGPNQAATDSQGNLWVADRNRVLMFPFDPALGHASSTATKVFGQYGSFATYGCDQSPPSGSPDPPAPSQYSLCMPTGMGGLAVDSQGTLYVADGGNNRVLVFFQAASKPSDPPADLVLGQPNFTSTPPNHTPASGAAPYTCGTPNPASNCTLNQPAGVSVDASGNVLVADTQNNRVLLWSAATLAHFGPGSCATGCFIPASQSWGQG
jgi:NHL repeat